MGFVSDLYNTAKTTLNPANGAGWQATAAPVVDPVTQAQVDAANGQVTSGIGQQQAFTNALGGAGSQGLSNQNLAAGLMAQTAQGVGPNAAQDQFNQNINQLAAQQAGSIASQKGLNPALQARLIAQQSGAAGQNAAGQAATQMAQQQLNAQSQLGSLGTQQVSQNQTALNSLNSAAQGNQSNMLGAQGSFNNALVGNQSNVNNANSGIAQSNIKTVGGLVNGAGAALMAHGGVVKEDGPVSGFGRHVASFKKGGVVPGRAAVSGDSPANDEVPITASPGEIMLPRSVTTHPEAPKKAAEYVAALMARKRGA